MKPIILKKAYTAKKINPAEAAAAQVLLESGSTKLEISSAELNNISDQIAFLNKKKKKKKKKKKNGDNASW